jgi:hypothetical protein
MKPEHKNLSPTELALLTWYAPDHPLHKDPEHPTIKLAGEIGELLDLYAKDKFKPNFDWMRCKNCGKCVVLHCFDGLGNIGCEGSDGTYTPRVLDELGDIWYYLRILAWIYDFDIEYDYSHLNDTRDLIVDMYYQAAIILNDVFQRSQIDGSRLRIIYGHLVNLLEQLDFTLEELTELNYYKLNSEESNHGWKGA